MGENITTHGDHGGTAADHDHGHGHAPFPFTPEEKKEFQKDDIFAGQAVVVLMTAIFLVGVVLYTVVAWSVGG